MFQVLDSVLRDLYRVLKMAAITERDDVTLHHVAMAQGQLDDIMTSYLFPKQTLQKQIHVLRPPTDV